jgi:hypothetical protein
MTFETLPFETETCDVRVFLSDALRLALQKKYLKLKYKCRTYLIKDMKIRSIKNDIKKKMNKIVKDNSVILYQLLIAFFMK